MEKLGKAYYIMLILMTITGTFNTVFTKLQNVAYDKILGAPFSHPWFQSFLMFIGEFYCAIIWFFAKNYLVKKEEEEKKEFIINNPKSSMAMKPELPEVSPYRFIIPCACDVIGTTLLNFALLQMAGSVFQMLRGGIVIVTCAFVVIFLKKYPKNYQWLGVGIVFLGIFIVGLSTQVNKSKEDDDNTTTTFLGIIMLIASLFFQGFQFIYEEKILLNYKCHPMQMVAWEGTWGLLTFIVLLPIFQFIPCDFNGKDKVCSGNSKEEYYLENTELAFQQSFDKIPVLLYAIGQTISIAGFNFFGIMVVKYSSSATRAVMDNARTVLVWIFFLLVPMSSGKILEQFSWLELLGFFIMVFGQVIYNGLVVVPFWGFNSHVHAHHKDEEKGLITQDEGKSDDEEEEDEDKEAIKQIDLRRSFIHS